MGLGRYFYLYAEHRDGSAIESEALADCVADTLNDLYSGWDGDLCEDCLRNEECNWYDWEEDMDRLSRKYPELVFSLHCEGSSFDDIWDAGFCDGRSDLRCAYIDPVDWQYLRTGKRKEDTDDAWISVDDALPTPPDETWAREWYLVCLSNGVVKELAYEFHGDSVFGQGWHDTAYPVVYWREKPAAPAALRAGSATCS